jgi:hypothetical protein
MRFVPNNFSFLLLAQNKRNKEKGSENANFSCFSLLATQAIAAPLHEKQLQFAPFSVLQPHRFYLISD